MEKIKKNQLKLVKVIESVNSNTGHFDKVLSLLKKRIKEVWKGIKDNQKERQKEEHKINEVIKKLGKWVLDAINSSGIKKVYIQIHLTH